MFWYPCWSSLCTGCGPTTWPKSPLSRLLGFRFLPYHQAIEVIGSDKKNTRSRRPTRGPIGSVHWWGQPYHFHSIQFSSSLPAKNIFDNLYTPVLQTPRLSLSISFRTLRLEPWRSLCSRRVNSFISLSLHLSLPLPTVASFIAPFFLMGFLVYELWSLPKEKRSELGDKESDRLSSYQYVGRSNSIIPTASLVGTEVSVEEIRSAAASSDRYPPSLHAPLLSSPEPDPNGKIADDPPGILLLWPWWWFHFYDLYPILCLAEFSTGLAAFLSIAMHVVREGFFMETRIVKMRDGDFK